MPQLLPLTDGDILVYKICFGTRPSDFLMMVEAADNFLEWVWSTFETKPKVYLTGSGNFRYKVATIKPYKGNRHADKPPHFKAVREYLINFWDAEVSEGVEADDCIASAANPSTVIVSTDKDFGQVGNTYLFNPTKNELKFTSEYEGWFRFYEQTLVGDQADNIPGVDGIGKVKAPRLLMDKTKEEMDNLVLDLYVKQYGDDGPRAFEEVKTLLWLKRDLYENTQSVQAK